MEEEVEDQHPLFETCLDERDQHPLASAGSVIEKYYRKVLAGQIFKKLKD